MHQINSKSANILEFESPFLSEILNWFHMKCNIPSTWYILLSNGTRIEGEHYLSIKQSVEYENLIRERIINKQHKSAISLLTNNTHLLKRWDTLSKQELLGTIDPATLTVATRDIEKDILKHFSTQISI